MNNSAVLNQDNQPSNQPLNQLSNQPAKKRRSLERKYSIVGLLFLSPALIFFAVFFIFPLFATFYLSFHSWDMLSPISEVINVGLQNYKDLWNDQRFLIALKNTFVFVAANILIMPVLSISAALLLHSVKVLPWLWRLLFFLPVVTSVVAMSLVWQYMFDPTYGPINEMLINLGLMPQGWIASTDQSLMSVIIVMLWKGMGYYAIIFLAGLQAIPEDYYEAAKIDGANAWQRFVSITLPMLKPSTLFVLVMVAINSFQVFTEVYILTNGGPVDSSNVLGVYIYQVAFGFHKMGYASSMAVILFLMILAFSVAQLRIMRQQDE